MSRHGTPNDGAFGLFVGLKVSPSKMTAGLMTYDREVIKIPAAELKQLHQELFK